MEKLIEAYSKWPAGNQLILAVIVVVFLGAGSVTLFILGIGFVSDFLHYLAIYFRGWPPDDTKKKPVALAVKQASALTVLKAGPQHMLALNKLLGDIAGTQGVAPVEEQPLQQLSLPVFSPGPLADGNGSQKQQ